MKLVKEMNKKNTKAQALKKQKKQLKEEIKKQK